MTSDDIQALVGTTVAGRYHVEKVLGEGGMGTVYRARADGMPVALKILNAAMLNNAEAVARFEREAIAASHIKHPNVVAADDFGTLDDGRNYIALEYLDGHDLRTELMEGPMRPARALGIIRQLTEALRAAHELGVIHRDLKPENIMLANPERQIDVVKLLDFGIAKVPVDELSGYPTRTPTAVLTRIGNVYGTPDYMSPEQARGEDVDGRADLYAVGVLLYEMLCGKRPFHASSRGEMITKLQSEAPPLIAERAPGTSVPTVVEYLCRRLLEKDPDDRPEDAAALIDAIEEALDSPAVKNWAPQPARPPSLDSAPPVLPSPFDHGDNRTTIAHQPPAERPTPRVPRDGRRTWLLPLAGLGLLAIAAALSTVAAKRDPAIVDALEEAARGTPTASAPLSAQPAAPTASVSAAPIENAPPPAPEAVEATPTELNRAIAGGVEALEVLADRFPADPKVLRELVRLKVGDDTDREATMIRLRQLFQVSVDDAANPDIHRYLLRAANAQPKVAQEAITMMSSRMGSHGPDLLYRVMIIETMGQYPRDRAAEELRRDVVRNLASPALLVALDLRKVPSACLRARLLPRAEQEADLRSVEYLRAMTEGRPCGYLKAQACMTCGKQIAADATRTIKAIEDREKAR